MTVDPETRAILYLKGTEMSGHTACCYDGVSIMKVAGHVKNAFFYGGDRIYYQTEPSGNLYLYQKNGIPLPMKQNVVWCSPPGDGF